MLNLVCALQCEADPLIENFQLKKVTPHHDFSIYEGDKLFLIVSGVGKMHAAAATAYLQACLGQRLSSSWLNVGIAGHKMHPVGKGFLAHQVVDHATQSTFYPPFVFDHSLPLASILTVDGVEREYTQDVIYEMEAFGFYTAANRFATQECIHCYKVISDNLLEPDRCDAGKIRALMAEHVDVIKHLAQSLLKISHQLQRVELSNEDMDFFLSRWRFTQTQTCQLEKRLLCLKACCPDFSLNLEHFLECQNAKDVLSKLLHLAYVSNNLSRGRDSRPS